MLTNISKKEQVPLIAIQPDRTTPVVSLFMPFEPKMVTKNELVYKLQLLVHEAELKLVKSFSFKVAEPVLKRLKAVVKNLDYSTHKRSIAIYVSAEGEKVFYLNTPLEEKVLIDTSFNVRSLIAHRKKLQHYLVLVLGTNISRIYFDNGEHLIAMFTNIRKKSRSEYGSSLETFLKETDNNLSIILNYFPSLPLFIMSSTYTLSRYKTITQNKTHITQLIEADGKEIVIDKIKTALQPYTHNWGYIQTKHLRHTLDNATDSSRIATGIENVVKAAHQRRAKLLVLEKDYTCPVVKAGKTADGLLGNVPFTDAVDEVIERVLSTGGEVTFADSEVLEKYQHIAMIY
ncbi:hypothetical protein FC093_01660 [Ilyomonas limi]|uniref:eRF1 domain-containing protein n=1 Tax=Ilyomonas limi TaxID=2575867 RepID=A0A4U3L8S9_9BACT|nr:hypothetical protein [Ilyomonas limi]TKK71755.1 hypothetical protein FC093_01660 [Ilyomonas limi]